jgi:polysaccharide pyruvyl transferase WcaK-like protein
VTRIGVIGWYGHGNAGDERILACLRRLFDGDELLPTRSLKDALERLEDLNRCDYVLFGGGGLVLRNTGRYAELFERLEPPFSCVGLGVEFRDPANKALLDVLKSRAEFIHVRDSDSCARLECHPNVITGTDLTFLYPYDVAPWSSAPSCALNLRPWPASPGPRPRGWLQRLIRETAPPPWNPRSAIECIRRHFSEIVPLPLYAEPGEPSDAELLAEHLEPGGREFSPQRLASCRYVVSMRLHALIFACQMGIPFVSLSYQPKNKAICRDLGMEWASVELGDSDALDAALGSLIARGPELRARLLDRREESVKCCWKTIEPVLDAIRARART